MSNRLRTLLGSAVMRKSGAAMFLALACSLGCGCLAGEGADEDGYDAPIADAAAAPVDGQVDGIADEVATGELDLATELATLEAKYQEQQTAFSTTDDPEDGDDGRRSNPEPTPWEPGAEDNPEPTPWHGGTGKNASNPEPTPWLDDDDDDEDDELELDSASLSADTSGGSGWGHGYD